MEEAVVAPRPRFAVALVRQLTKPIQLVIPPTIGLLLVAQHYGFVAERPAWYYPALILALTCATSVSDVLWPDGTCTNEQMVYRTSTMIVAISVGIYATGWGPTLAVAYGYAVSYAIRYAGSKATTPMMACTLACITLGQVAIATGIAPTLIDEPLVHGLALLAAAVTALTIAFQGVVIAEKEALERTSRRLQAELAHQAFHDSLTKLPNRTAFLEHLEDALDRRTPGPGHAPGHLHTAVLFVDVDHFKHVNDRLGHAVGDQLLDEVADRLRESIRPGDVVARFGGDEFTVLLKNVRSADDAKQVADRITREMRVPMQIASHELRVSASIGIALSDASSSADELLRDADLAMYLAKRNGRARWELFETASAP
jgi:diguanylate cyclase (GGDEF)-like protein